MRWPSSRSPQTANPPNGGEGSRLGLGGPDEAAASGSSEEGGESGGTKELREAPEAGKAWAARGRGRALGRWASAICIRHVWELGKLGRVCGRFFSFRR